MEKNTQIGSKFKQRLLKNRIIKGTFGKAKNINGKFVEIPKENAKLKKYQLKDSENADIWLISEKFNNKKLDENVEKPNLNEDIFKEMLGFKLKRLNKSGTRTPKEMWQRFKYLSKGLTLDEWSDRVESSWENMLEYSEKLWETFFIYSFKHYKWYPYAQKFWSESWYGQNWRNWRREEDAITWQTNSRIPWNKHIRLTNDFSIVEPVKSKLKGDYTFPQNAEKTLGATRLKLKNQLFANTSRHEILKQGVYNLEQPEFSALNSWQDSANIYLKYIRPWLFRLNFLDKPVVSTYKPLGKNQHRRNYQVVPQRSVFQSELYQISYNLKLIQQLSSIKESQLERKFGKRNTKMYFQNKNKLKEMLNYEKLLHFRQTNQNLAMNMPTFLPTLN